MPNVKREAHDGRLQFMAHFHRPTHNRPGRQCSTVIASRGISAAANALALTLLGEAEVSIYDGSLEEWAADPALPLVSRIDTAP